MCTKCVTFHVPLQKSINIVGCAEKADLVNALVKGGVTCVAGKGQAGSSLSPAAQHMLDKMAKRMFEVHERMCRLRGAKSPLMPSAFSRYVSEFDPEIQTFT